MSIVAGLALVGAAGGAYPGMGTTRSAVSPDGKLRYEADAQHGRTVLGVLREGERTRSTTLHGLYGFPLPTNDSREGVSHDGRTLVLAGVGSFGHFAVLDSRTLHVRRTIALQGQFSYDALSPNARTLYLIQHVSPPDRYYVRAYDLSAGRLLKQIVFDTREKGVMRGAPVSRVTGPSGRWVYTLYGRSNGTIFVHALDSVDRHAFCVDLPARVSSEAMSGLRLKLTGSTLAVRNGTKRIGAIDTKTLRVTTR